MSWRVDSVIWWTRVTEAFGLFIFLGCLVTESFGRSGGNVVVVKS